MRAFFLMLCLVIAASFAKADTKLPGESARLLPMLASEIDTFWPSLSPRAFPAGVIDQESNWKPTATLKTSRELGCGLGQFTIAYDAKHAVRFDALAETKRLDKSLAEWDWRDCQAVKFQLRAVVLKLKQNERTCLAYMNGNDNVKACDAAANNGGIGSVTKRIRSCQADPSCHPREWFGHLETQCPQGRVKVAGYGESFCEINSKYPGRVFSRMKKFEAALTKKETPLLPITVASK